MREAPVRLLTLVKQTPLRDGTTGCPPARRQECAISGPTPTAWRTDEFDPEALQDPSCELMYSARKRSSAEGVDCKPTGTLPLRRVERNRTTIWLAHL